jgi:hypothetical protein
MHVVMVILGGFLLLGIFVLFGWLWGASVVGMATASKAFVPIWLLMAGMNMWVGIHFAGYSARTEFPIFLLVFAVPAIAAGIAIWRLSLL